MGNITEMIGKQVYDLREAKSWGVISNACVDNKLTKVKGYSLINDDEDERHFLPPQAIIGSGDVVTIMHSGKLKTCNNIPCPIGAYVFDSKGGKLGKLTDVIIENNNEIVEVQINGKNTNDFNVISFSDNAVILRHSEHKDFKIFGKRKSTQSAKDERQNAHENNVEKPLIMQDNFVTADIGEIIEKDALSPYSESEQNTAKSETEAITKSDAETDVENGEENVAFTRANYEFGDYAFLMGRRITKNIFSNDELVARAGEIVNEQTIDKARWFGKLVELTVNSKKI